MKRALLDLLCCPGCAGDLSLIEAGEESGEVTCGRLRCSGCAREYPITGSVPRFVPTDNYARSFGLQWNRFRRTQLDRYSGLTVSRERFFRQTGWSPADLDGQTVLDVGCGAGRFAEVASSCRARVVAIDYSSAVDACWDNLGHDPRLDVVQADVYALPFRRGRFSFVYSLGVLQHTPDVRRAFMALPLQLAPGGALVVDLYLRSPAYWTHPKAWLRPLTRRIPSHVLFAMVEGSTPTLLALSRAMGRVPRMGRFLKRLVPVANYEGIYPLSERQVREWATLDTFDWLAPRYDQPQTPATLQAWLVAAGLKEVEVVRLDHLTGRGRKPLPA